MHIYPFVRTILHAIYSTVAGWSSAVSKRKDDRESQTTRSPSSSSAGAGTAIGREGRYFLLTVQLLTTLHYSSPQLSVCLSIPCLLFLKSARQIRRGYHKPSTSHPDRPTQLSAAVPTPDRNAARADRWTEACSCMHEGFSFSKTTRRSDSPLF